MPQAKLFISHSRKDAQFARRLRRALDKRGMQAWADAEVRGNNARADQVERALRAASWYVVLVSEEALRSKWVNFEIGAAIGQGKMLIPVFLTKHARREAPSPLTARQGILAEGMSPNDIAERIVGTIERAAA